MKPKCASFRKLLIVSRFTDAEVLTHNSRYSASILSTCILLEEIEEHIISRLYSKMPCSRICGIAFHSLRIGPHFDNKILSISGKCSSSDFISFEYVRESLLNVESDVVEELEISQFLSPALTPNAILIKEAGIFSCPVAYFCHKESKLHVVFLQCLLSSLK